MADGTTAVPWWRWLAGCWAALAIAAAAFHSWGALGTALLFLAGLLTNEFWRRDRPPPAAPTRTALAGLAAAFGAAGVTLALRFTFSVPAGWTVGVLVFAALLALHTAGPAVADRVRPRP